MSFFSKVREVDQYLDSHIFNEDATYVAKIVFAVWMCLLSGSIGLIAFYVIATIRLT